jgi:hypothetical protein
MEVGEKNKNSKKNSKKNKQFGCLRVYLKQIISIDDCLFNQLNNNYDILN